MGFGEMFFVHLVWLTRSLKSAIPTSLNTVFIATGKSSSKIIVLWYWTSHSNKMTQYKYCRCRRALRTLKKKWEKKVFIDSSSEEWNFGTAIVDSNWDNSMLEGGQKEDRKECRLVTGRGVRHLHDVNTNLLTSATHLWGTPLLSCGSRSSLAPLPQFKGHSLGLMYHRRM